MATKKSAAPKAKANTKSAGKPKPKSAAKPKAKAKTTVKVAAKVKPKAKSATPAKAAAKPARATKAKPAGKAKPAAGKKAAAKSPAGKPIPGKAAAKASTRKPVTKAAPAKKPAVKPQVQPKQTAPTAVPKPKSNPAPKSKTPAPKSAPSAKPVTATDKKPVTTKSISSTSMSNKAATKNLASKGKAPAKPVTTTINGDGKGFIPYEMEKGEEYMNDRQKEHFKKILLDWRNELMQEVDRTVHHMQDEAANPPDPADRATLEEEFSIELRTRDRERRLIKKIDSTIELIANDDYGYCDSCGVEIGIRRLEARPTANKCIDCKTLDEIKEKQLGSA